MDQADAQWENLARKAWSPALYLTSQLSSSAAFKKKKKSHLTNRQF